MTTVIHLNDLSVGENAFVEILSFDERSGETRALMTLERGQAQKLLEILLQCFELENEWPT